MSREFGTQTGNDFRPGDGCGFATFDLRVSFGGEIVPGFVTSLVGIEAGNHTVQQAFPLCGGKAKDFKFQSFDR